MKIVARASLIGCLLMTFRLFVDGENAEDTNTTPLPFSYNHDDATAPRRLTRGSATWTTGVWGSWSRWSECSRTCGRGVSTQTRECVEGSGYIRHQRLRQSRTHGNKSPVDEKLCLGISRRVQLCKTQECKLPVDVRRELCQAFNSKPFLGRFYQWEPFFKDTVDCELRCQPIGERFFATLAKVVEDGTPCGDHRALDKICVAGDCKVIGCDGIIGSTAKIDQCGICGGQDSSCRRVSAIYSQPTLTPGYNRVTVIPSGASNINISDFVHTRNYLALKSDDDHFFINGNFSITRSGDYKAAGTVFRYVRSDPRGYAGQKITAEGPTDRPIELFIIFQQRNRGVSYAYSLPVKRPRKKDVAVRNGFGSSKEAKISLLSRNNLTEFNAKSSTDYGQKKDSFSLRERTKEPNLTTLAPRLTEGVEISRSNVSPPGDIQATRNSNHANSRPTSKQRDAEVTLETAETSSVNSRIKDILNDVAFNHKQNGRFGWRMTGFGPCSQSCGGGTSQPLLKCFTLKSAKHEPAKHVVQEFLCSRLPKPQVRAIPCNKQVCPPSWETGKWADCNVTCGPGFQIRKVYCAKIGSLSTSVPLSDEFCAKLSTRPENRQPCNISACAKWKTSSWSKCTADCGKGTRTRKASCANKDDSAVDESFCVGPKPELEETCFTRACGGARWITTDWQKCFGSCDSSMQSRRVICLEGDKKVPSEFCDHDKRPDESRPCDKSLVSCRKGSWFVGPWSQCSSPCGPGSQTREVVCLSKEKASRRKLADVSACSVPEKPLSKQKCDNPPCEDSQWYVGQWSTCTKSCGSGHQSREVFCLSYGQSLGEGCSSKIKPLTLQSCNTATCSEYLQGDRTVDFAKPSVNAVSNCTNVWSNCELAVQARLCSTSHYRNICCLSCSKARTTRKSRLLKEMTNKRSSGH